MGFLSKLFGRKTPEGPQQPPSVPAQAPEGEAEQPKAARGPRPDEPFRLEEVAQYPVEQRQILGEETLFGCEQVLGQVKEHFEGSLENLPAFPSLAMQLFDLLQRPDVEVGELVKLIGRDPSTTAQLLKVANSSFYSTYEPAKSVRDAVMRIGIRETANIAALAVTGPLFDPEVESLQKAFASLWERFWRHSVVCASATGSIANEWHRGDPMQCFLAGMLHDIGKTFALRSFGALVVMGGASNLGEDQVEYLIESLHAELGARVARHWKLPPAVTRACEEHHVVDLDASPENREVHLVRVVSALDEFSCNPRYRASLPTELDRSVQAMQLQPRHLRILAKALREQAEKNPAFLGREKAKAPAGPAAAAAG